MLSFLISFSLRHRGVVIALGALMAMYGLYTLTEATYDVFPEFASPQVDIQTEAPGLAPEQVEILVTQRIENAVNGVPGIESIRSSSIQGLSVITIAFRPSRNITLDRQAIAERLAPVAATLSQEGIGAPAMTPLTSTTGDLMTIGLTSENLSLMELRTIADWTVKQRLLGVSGVAKVGVYGGDVKQLQIRVHPDLLVQYNVSIEDVLATARRLTGIRGAGWIDLPNQRIVLQTQGIPPSPDMFAKTVMTVSNAGGTASLTLGDVATVVEAPAKPISAASVMGRPGIMLNVWAQHGANTLEASKRVEEALDELRPTLDAQGVAMDTSLFRAAAFVETAVRNIKISLIAGAVLVAIVLFLFLFNLRTAAISCVAIPFSLLGAVTMLHYLGHSLNTMTLGGLAIAIGEVVDDGVIDVENILRRLRENSRLSDPRPILRVIYDASIEVRSAVVYATMAVVLVFIPVLTMTGLAGRLFAPLGIAYILAILFSLLIALTITPALCYLLIDRTHSAERESPLAGALKKRYDPLLRWVERHSGAVIGAAVILAVLTFSTLPFLGGDFLPEFHEGHFIVHVAALPGTSLQESLRLGQRVTAKLLQMPAIRVVAERIGRAEADDIFGTNAGEMEVDLKPTSGENAEVVQRQIRDALANFPGASFAVNTFLTERIEETLSGYTSSVVVNLFGNSLDELDKKAREVADVLRSIPGAADVQIQSPSGTPALVVALRSEDLARWGFAPVDVLDAVKTAYEGDMTGQIHDGNRTYPVSVMLDPDERKTVARVGELPLRSPGGVYVHLRQVADIYQTSGRSVVLHEGARRAQTITCNVTGRDVGSFTEEAKNKVGRFKFPTGMYPAFSGEAEAQARSQRDLYVHAALAGIAILLLLWIVMDNLHNLGLVVINLPFSIAGGILAVLLTGGTLTTGSLVGFVTIFGISLRNSIMLISHYEHLVSEENCAWGLETAFRGALERLRPILMTAIVTGLGMLPLALGSGEPGREIEGPMAIVILGGLVTSTALNLIVLPSLALRFGRFGVSSTVENEPMARPT